MYLDDLPIWGMVGEKYQGEGQADKDTDKFVFTHRRLSVAYNGPRIIQVDGAVVIQGGMNHTPPSTLKCIRGSCYPSCFLLNEWFVDSHL